MPIARLIIFILLNLYSWSLTAGNFDLLPDESIVLEGYDIDSVKMRMKQSPLHTIEGVWQFVGDGATIVIEQFNPDMIAGTQHNFYRIVIIKSPMLSISPGTVMGYMAATAKKDCFDARLYTSGGIQGVLSTPRTFTITLTDDNRLSFSEYKKEIKVNLWRWLPYVYRVGISIKDTRPKGLDGCLRIYPPSTTQPINPRYL